MGLNVYITRTYHITYDNGVTMEEKEEDVFDGGTTHNLTEMADKAGIYEALWRPYRLKENYIEFGDGKYTEELDFESNNPTNAKELIPFLEKGLADLKSRREYFEKFNSPNGWGMYEHFVPFVERYLEACNQYPDLKVNVSR